MKHPNIYHQKKSNEVVTLTSETPYCEDHFKTKLQAKFSKSNLSFRQKKKNLWISR